MRMPRIRLYGGILIVFPLLLWAAWSVWQATRTWCLVTNMPISLVQGSRFSTPVFSSNLKSQFAIEVSTDAKNLANKMAFSDRCSFGIQDFPRCTTLPALRLHWVLSRYGTPIREGDSDELIGYGDIEGSDVVRDIGFFRRLRGGGYRIDLNVIRSDNRLNSMKPRLSVVLFDTTYESISVISFFLKVICSTIAIFGLILILASFILSKRRTEEQTSANPKASA